MTRPGIAPDDPRHGQNKGYNAGCHCDACVEAHRAYRAGLRKKHRDGVGDLYIDAIPTQRRIRALLALGWRYADIDAHRGYNHAYNRSSTTHVMDRTKVHVDTARSIADVYRRLHMKPGPSDLVRNRARDLGYLPPLAWDDIDDVNENPRQASKHLRKPVKWQPRRRDLDQAVVDRVLMGDYSVAKGASRPEQEAVWLRWKARGRSLTSLERVTGWNVARIIREMEEREREADDDAA